MTNREYMTRAIELASVAKENGDVPVGAVIVKDGKIIGEGYNRREKDNNALAHAEIIAIDEACRNTGSWRLDNSRMYVTLEPCSMCTGAIINARIKTVYYSLIDFKAGAMGGKLNLLSRGLNHNVETVVGICREESEKLLDDFFENLRKNK